MRFPSDLDALWEMWEQSVLQAGIEDTQADQLGQHIVKLEQESCPAEKVGEETHCDALTKAHRILDQLCSKKKPGHANHLLSGHRVIKTQYGAIYHDSVSVRGMERLLERVADGHCAIRLKDGFYHVNYLPGVQPTASEQVNARNKNVERINVSVVESFIQACKATGMQKRGWKKHVNEKFDISRQEFTKWLHRYFPLYHMSIPEERKSS